MRRVSLNTPGVELTNGCCDRTSDSLKNDPIFDACHIRWICQWYQGNTCEKCDVWYVRCLSLFSRFFVKELNFSPIFRSVNDVNTVGTIWRNQVWSLTQFFKFSFYDFVNDRFAWRASQCPPIWLLFSTVTPSNSLVSLANPWRAVWVDKVHQVPCVAPGTYPGDTRTPWSVPH